jgi:hypothetical protein
MSESSETAPPVTVERPGRCARARLPATSAGQRARSKLPTGYCRALRSGLRRNRLRASVLKVSSSAKAGDLRFRLHRSASQVVGRLAFARVGPAPRLPPRACSAEDDTGGANGGSTSRAAGITRTVPTRAESAEQRNGTEPGVFSIRCWHSQFRSPGPGACPSMSFLQRQGTRDRFRSSSWMLSSLRWQTNSSRRRSTTHWRPPCCGDCCARYFAGENNGGARPRGAPQFLETGASPHGFGERYFKSAATASRPAFAHSSS